MLVAEYSMVLELLKDLKTGAVCTGCADRPNHKTNLSMPTLGVRMRRWRSASQREAGGLKFVGDEWSDVMLSMPC